METGALCSADCFYRSPSRPAGRLIQKIWEGRKGKTDEYQYDYLDDNLRFADQVNGALFAGRQVVKPHELVEIDEELKGYVTNYRLNLYECHEHDTFDEYRTGLRQFFEVVRYSQDKEKLREIMEKNRAAYSRMDSETRELLEVVAGVRIGEETATMENGEKKFNMCKAFVDMKLEGIEEGSRKRLVNMVCKKLLKNKPASVIADELEEELSEIEKVTEAQKQAGSYDVEQICRVLTDMRRAATS